MSPDDDQLRADLDRAVPSAGDEERAWAAIQRRLGGARTPRPAALVALGAAAAIAVVAAALVVQHQPKPDQRVVAGTSTTEEATPASWPWVTSTTAPPRSHTEAEITAINAEIAGMATGRNREGWRSTGVTRLDDAGDFSPDGRWVVAVHLRADNVTDAAELWRRWGDALVIQVGNFLYPSGEPVGRVECPEPSPDAQPGVAALVELDGAEVASGADFTGTATVTNRGAKRVDATTGGRMVGVVVRPGTDDVVGVWDGASTAEARLIDLAPGESTQLPVVGGTATCSPDGPPGLPPGRYEVLVAVGGGGGDPPLAVGRAPLTVTGDQPAETDRTLAYVVTEAGNIERYVAAGAAPERLYTAPSDIEITSIARTPDGTTVMVTVAGPGGPCDQEIRRLENGRLSPVIAKGVNPSLSPDGTRLAYETATDAVTTCSRTMLVVRDLRTGTEKRWTSGEGPSDPNQLVSPPAWSPDSQTLAFGTFAARTYLLDVDSAARSITDARLLRPRQPGIQQPLWDYTTGELFVRDVTGVLARASSPVVEIDPESGEVLRILVPDVFSAISFTGAPNALLARPRPEPIGKETLVITDGRTSVVVAEGRFRSAG